MNVLVTRPQSHSQQLVDSLITEGYQPQNVAVVDLLPESPDVLSSCHEALQSVDENSLLIAVSQTAIEFASESLLAIPEALRANIKAFAVGEKTAQVFSALGFQVTVPEQQNSEGLLALESFSESALANRKVYILCGRGGRELLHERLEQRGAHVNRLEWYYRCQRDEASAELAQLTHAPDYLTAMSGETLQALDQSLLRADLAHWRHTAIIVPSQRVADEAISLGYTLVKVAEQPTSTALLDVINTMNKDIPQGDGMTKDAKNTKDNSLTESLPDAVDKGVDKQGTDKDGMNKSSQAQPNNQEPNNEYSVEKISNSNDTSTIDEPQEVQPDSSSADNTSAASSTSKPNKKRGGGVLVVVLYLLLLLLVIAGGYWFYTELQRLDESIDSRLSVGENSVQTLQSSLTNMQAKTASDSQRAIANITDRQSVVEQELTTLRLENERQFDALANRIRLQPGIDDNEWVLAEADYLVRMAHQRLVSGFGAESAIELLQAADEQLASLGYPELRNARRIIKQDLINLKLTQPVDVEGLYFEIDALINRASSLLYTAAPKLTYIPEQEANQLDEVASAEEQENEGFNWRDYRKYVARVKSLIAPFFIHRTENQQLQGLMSQKDEVALQTQIQLLLRQTQLALLSQNQELYSRSLSNAAAEALSGFPNNQPASHLAEQFQRLSEQKIQEEVLDIGASVAALDEAIAVIRRLEDDASSTPAAVQ